MLAQGAIASPFEIGVDPPQAPRIAAYPRHPVEFQRLLKPLGSVLRFQRSHADTDYPPPTIYEVRTTLILKGITAD